MLTLRAGLAHDLFASGGPLLVYALAGTQLDKRRLRATLLCVWFSLNACLSLMLLMQGELVPALPRLPWFIPLLVLGMLVGEYLHHRVNEQRFRQLVYGLLLVTGTILTLQSLQGSVDRPQPGQAQLLHLHGPLLHPGLVKAQLHGIATAAPDRQMQGLDQGLIRSPGQVAAGIEYPSPHGQELAPGPLLMLLLGNPRLEAASWLLCSKRAS